MIFDGGVCVSRPYGYVLMLETSMLFHRGRSRRLTLAYTLCDIGRLYMPLVDESAANHRMTFWGTNGLSG